MTADEPRPLGDYAGRWLDRLGASLSRGLRGYAKGGEVGPRKNDDGSIAGRVSDPHVWLTREQYRKLRRIDAINQGTIVHILEVGDQQ